MNATMLRKLMRRRHITQNDLARLLGIDRCTFGRKLSDRRRGSEFCISEARQISAALDLSPLQMAKLFFDE